MHKTARICKVIFLTMKEFIWKILQKMFSKILLYFLQQANAGLIIVIELYFKIFTDALDPILEIPPRFLLRLGLLRVLRHVLKQVKDLTLGWHSFYPFWVLCAIKFHFTHSLSLPSNLSIQGRAKLMVRPEHVFP